MILDRLDATFAFAKEALEARSYRQGLLVSNIAIADAPGYKAVDVDFSSTMSTALAYSNQGGVQRGFAGSAENVFGFTDCHERHRSYRQVKHYRRRCGSLCAGAVPSATSLDNNTVDL